MSKEKFRIVLFKQKKKMFILYIYILYTVVIYLYITIFTNMFKQWVNYINCDILSSETMCKSKALNRFTEVIMCSSEALLNTTCLLQDRRRLEQCDYVSCVKRQKNSCYSRHHFTDISTCTKLKDRKSKKFHNYMKWDLKINMVVIGSIAD